MTAQDRLKQYFYEHIIKHEDFDISEFEDMEGNIEKLPENFDNLIQMFDDYGVDDWYFEFDIDELEVDYEEEHKGCTYIFKVNDDLFVSIWNNRVEGLCFETSEYVKEVEVTRTEWQPIS